MPIIAVKMAKGRSVEQKRALVRALTKAAVDILHAQPEWVTVLIEEVDDWAVGGELLRDTLGAKPGEGASA